MTTLLLIVWGALLTWMLDFWSAFRTVLGNECGTVILSNQTTGNIEQAQRQVDMSETIMLLEPDETPFVQLLRKLSKRKTISPKFEWLEDVARPNVDQINKVGGYGAGVTDLIVDNIGYFAVGDIVKVFRTGETMRVTVVTAGTSTITVTRSWGTVAAAALNDDDFLYIMGGANQEGGTAATPRMTKKVPKFNYCQIFKEPVKLSKTLEASGLYGVGSERAFQRRKKGIDHNRAIERALWFGERNEDLSGDPVRSTGGVFEFITTNKTTLANDAAFTQAALDAFLRDIFLVGTETRWAFTSPYLLGLINVFSHGKINIMQLEMGQAAGRTYGISLARYQSAHGAVNLINTRIFKDYRTAGNVAGKVLVALDVDDEGAQYRFLQGRDTALKTDIQANDADFYLDEYLTECGLKLGQEKRHGILEING